MQHMKNFTFNNPIRPQSSQKHKETLFVFLSKSWCAI